MNDVKIVLHSDAVSRYYAETLCLLVFPRSRFADDLPEGHVPRVDVRCDINGGRVDAAVGITTAEDTFRGAFSCENKRGLYMDPAALAVGRAFAEAAVKLGLVPRPWGLLTGVRPAKPLLYALLRGESLDGAMRELVEDHLVFPQKAELAAAVARREARLVEGIKKRACGIYISVPFCPTRCAYCSFVSYALPGLMALIPNYTEHLISDVAAVGKEVKALGIDVAAVYIGGGTPTILSAEALERLCGAVTEAFPEGAAREFTVEAGRPDTLSDEKFAVMKRGGVSRISINPQTLQDKTLANIGRDHSVGDFYRAFAASEKYGFVRNADLILGLPGESPGDFADSVSGVIGLAPENVTLHSFCIKKAADLAADPASLSGADLLPAQEKAFAALGGAGYAPYYVYRQKNAVGDLENAGFSKEGAECVYNVIMMEETHTVIGIGAGASTRVVSRDGKTIARKYAPKYPYEYRDFDIGGTVAYIREFYENKF